MAISASTRAYLRSLLDDRNLTLFRVTEAHRDVLDDAGIPCRIGQSLDALFDSITPQQADALADVLRDDEMEEI